MKNASSILSSLSSPFANPQRGFYAFGALTLLSVAGGWLVDQPYLLALPFAVLLGLCILVNFRFVFLMLVFALPLSIEYEVVPGGLATDLPTEPLMLVIMLSGWLYLLATPRALSRSFWQHPLLLLLGLHLLWIGVCVAYSQIFLVSFKFLLAKMWYVTVFVPVAALFLPNQRSYRAAFWCLLLPLLGVIGYTLVRHYTYDFDFIKANIVMIPFFRNHVNYAVTLVAFFPFLLNSWFWYPSNTFKGALVRLSVAVFLVGIFYSYTRSAYVCVLLLPVAYLLFRWQLTRYLATIGITTVVLAATYYSIDSRYLEMAPNFERTIYHENLGDHLSATFDGTDVSFMERIYRWVAAFNMSADRPVVGFGPGNFYNFYQYYTVTGFKTYVSDNPEKSGVHNYFLMTMVEQGYIGLALFVALLVGFFLHGERIYHRQTTANDRRFVMTILLSQFIIILNLTMSDLLEVDKIGSLFLMNIAMLICHDRPPLTDRSSKPTTTSI